MRSIVSFKGILVNRDSISKLAITRLESNVKSSSEKENESLIVYSLDAKMRVKNMKESTVSDHCLQCHFVISFDDFDVLSSETNNFRLLIKESLLIKRDKPILNRTIKSFPLKLFD